MAVYNIPLMNDVKVVGVTFENEDGVNRQALISEMGSLDVVRFVPEADNKYDGCAIAVVNRVGERLGYLSKYKNLPDSNNARMLVARALKAEADGTGFIYATAYKVGGFPTEDGGRASLGLRLDWYFDTSKSEPKEEEDDPVIQPRKNSGKQKPKKPGKEYRDVLVKRKRHHPERFSYHEIEAMKERRCG